MSRLNYQVILSYNPLLFRTVLKYLKPKKKEKILDLGCGRGFYVKAMEKYTDEIVGVDINREAVKKAISQKVIYGDATNLNFNSNTFDKIYSLHTIEHIVDLKKFFKEVSRILKAEGIIVLVYPWELIRGIQVVGTATIYYKNPFKARELHLHKLTPQKIQILIKDTSLHHLKSKFSLALGFHYITILEKRIRSN